MKKITLLFLSLFVGYAGFAQEPDAAGARQWTLQECIEYAHQHNLQVKQSQLTMLSSKVELDRSKADLFPSLNAGTGFSNAVGRSIDPFTNTMIDVPVTSQNYNLSSGVTVFNGFSQQNLIKQNKADFRANEFELAQTRNDISLQIVTAYTNILFNKELLAQSEGRLQATGLQRDRTRRQVEVGVLPQASLYEIEAQYASDEVARTNAANNLEFALLNLKQLLQLPADANMEVVDPGIEITEVQPYPVSAQEVYEVAEETQPGIAAAEARIESSQLGVQVAKGNLLPSITAQGGFVTNYSSVGPDVEYIDQLELQLRRYVSVNLNIPIFNGMRTRSNVSQARIRQDQSALQSQIARQQLRQTIEQAAQDVKAAALTYRSNENQVRSLREAFRSSEQRFNLGATNAVDYNIAKTNMDVAESNLIRAKYDYIFKMKILDFYLNKPLSFD